MKYTAAPMEGITGYVYRNAHYKHFSQTDCYYTPFVSPNKNRAIGGRDKQDVLPEHNTNIPVIPQVLTNHCDYFLRTAEILQSYGYTQINLNLGCPSGTVVTKRKGAGFLSELDKLHTFLEFVFTYCPIDISLKTRLGMSQPEEVFALQTMFQEYPVKEWILHARVREDYYQHTPHKEIFKQVYDTCTIPLCYNGDVTSITDAKEIETTFSNLSGCMIGRGLLTNPSLIREIKGGVPMTKQEFANFHTDICNGYVQIMSGERNVLFKLKELWTYWGKHDFFVEQQKQLKKIKKSTTLSEYQAMVDIVL